MRNTIDETEEKNEETYTCKDIRAYYDFYNVDKSFLEIDFVVVVVDDVLTGAYYSMVDKNLEDSHPMVKYYLLVTKNNSMMKMMMK
jgi:hypothetical protein